MLDKNSLAWLMVRAVGIYFAAQFLLHCLPMLEYVLHLNAMHIVAAANPGPETEASISLAWSNVGLQGAELALFVFLAFYFLRRGTFVHRLLTFRGDNET